MKKSTIPQPPKHLTTEAKRWWKRITCEYAIDDDAGFLLLQTALEAFDRMKEAQTIIGKDGATIRDRFDQIKTHPQITVERDARSAMLQSLKALNLDLEPLQERPGRAGGR